MNVCYETGLNRQFGFLNPELALPNWLASMTGVALAIVIFTLGVRLLLLPLSKAAALGGKARAELMPRVQQLRDRYRHDPQPLQREITGLQRESGVSMFTGCVPALAQIPYFIVMYRLFYATTIAGHPNMLLAGTLFGAPLGGHFVVLASGPHVLGFVALFALLAIVAWFSSRWQARQGQGSGTAAPAALRHGARGGGGSARGRPVPAGVQYLDRGGACGVARLRLSRVPVIFGYGRSPHARRFLGWAQIPGEKAEAGH